MAEASKATIVVTPAVEEVTETRVVLSLTEEEAQVLANLIYGHIGGDCHNRNLFDGISKALRPHVAYPTSLPVITAAYIQAHQLHLK